MIQVDTESVITVKLTMDEKTAAWLRDYLQNSTDQSEPRESLDIRTSIFQTLKVGLKSAGSDL